MKSAVVAGLVSVVVAGLAGVGVVGALDGPDSPQRASLVGTAPIVPESPEPLEPGEAYVRTVVLSSGDSVVTHWIESRQLLLGLALAAPLADGTATEELMAEKIVVVADGRVVSGPERILAGDVARYSFLGTTSVQIRYRLTGVVERSGSTPGRALARLTALDVTHEPVSTLVTHAIVAPEVLSLACASPPGSESPRPCGARRSAGEWAVDLVTPFTRDRVIAQLSLE